ncbi:DNA-directed RNA polymerase III subunit RPC10-like [Lotus japonicus]|uniref:DNA-directed RNA polymerase III subunit RPC10-like n=1 Tax=Lotus japonicus TaxID=34305 RepID=UPI00258537DE|nr:DNA-directed RNA polymerase III subunit RPC10-like [Lotus japonicus]XP_057439691.1 DNA-directed RNA polymerase III subunit RPC10-like [Lotus japonicus]
MEFCPSCSNMLKFELPNMGHNSRLFCQTCPYVCYIEKGVKIKRKQSLVRKEIDPVISYDDMKNAPTTEVRCPNCSHDKAAYTEMQIRSADEPATIFYWCLNEKCRHQWRED